MVKNSWIAMLAVCGCVPAASLAQFVFFDDFNGNDLLPHWGPPPSSHWDYNVSNGMLNVTALHYPGFVTNYAILWTNFEHQTDFRVDVWMGWQAGDAPQRLELRVLGPWAAGPIIANFGYRFLHVTGPRELYASASNQAVFAPALPAGFHHFAISRTGTQFNFLLDGSPFASFPDLFGLPAGGLNIAFFGPVGGQFGTLHVDRVRVVPAPGSCAVLAALGLFCGHRRRCSRRS